MKSRIFGAGSSSKEIFILPLCSLLFRVSSNDLTQDLLQKLNLHSISKNPGVTQGSTVILPSLLNSFISPYTKCGDSPYILQCSCLLVHCYCHAYILCSASCTLSLKAPDNILRPYFCKPMSIFKTIL